MERDVMFLVLPIRFLCIIEREKEEEFISERASVVKTYYGGEEESLYERKGWKS